MRPQFSPLCYVFVVLAMLLGASVAAASGTATTTTTLAVTSAGSAVTTVISGSVVTLTATVVAGSTPVTTGLVQFCDATAAHCEDIHVLGAAQLTSAGTAVFKFRPGVGSHSYSAVFVGTKTNAGSASSASALAVTFSPPYRTVSSIALIGSTPPSYSFTATVGGSGSTAPTGTVSFLDTSNSNAVLGTGTLSAVAGVPSLTNIPVSTQSLYSIWDAIAVGDFNGDGIPDMVLGNSEGVTNFPSNLTVYLGNGDGSSTLGSSPATSGTPLAIAVGDFNGDGILDLAVSISDGSGVGKVEVLLGNGDGTFKAGVLNQFTVGNSNAIAVGDFNGDGIPDLAAAVYASNTVVILLGNGDGTFTATAVNPSAGVYPTGVKVGDFNRDGIPDLAVANAGGVAILLGHGDGTFVTSAVSVPGAYVSSQIVVGDFNGDGVPDLGLVIESSTYPGPGAMIDSVGLLLGNGDGTFAVSASTPNIQGVNIFIAAGDFNGDGRSDVATTSTYSPSGFAGALLLLDSVSTASASVTIADSTGTHQVAGSYPGDSNYGASVSPTVLVNAPVTPTSLSLTVSPVGPVVGQPVTLTATLSPSTANGHSSDGEMITFTGTNTSASAALGTGTLSGGIATLTTTALPAGSNILSASYAGGGYLQSSRANLTLTVSTSQPTLGLSVSPVNSTSGQPVTLTATLASYDNYSSNGTVVTFSSNGKVIGTGTVASGSASFATSSLSPGVDTLTASYPGDPGNSAAISNFATEAVAKSGEAIPSVTLALTSAGAPVTTVARGTPVTLTATAVTSTGTPITHGTITFCDTAWVGKCSGMAGLGAGQLTSNGTAAITVLFGIGTHGLQAIFNGNTGNPASLSSTSSLIVSGKYATGAYIGAYPGSQWQGWVAAVGSNQIPFPTGTMKIIDTSYSNTVLYDLQVSPPGSYFSLFNPGAQTPATGTTPFSIAAGDFNHDGIPDLVAANSGANTVSVLMGNGDGTFKTQATYATGSGAYSVAVGDFNGDGNPDLAVTNFSDNTVSILLGKSDGAFGAQKTFATGGGPDSVVVGDFNGDGTMDLAVANSTDATVSILLGNGDGTFQAQQTYATGKGPASIAAGDFNGDGILDLAAANNGDKTVSILLGNGDGSFQTQVAYATGKNPAAVALGDFRGNGILDLAVANLSDNTVSVLLGNGDGTFQIQAAYPTGKSPDAVVTGNLNGLGHVDLAVANSSDNTVTVLGNDGNGVFASVPATYSTGAGPILMALADVNNDGLPDLAVLDNIAATVTVLVNASGPQTGTGFFGLLLPGDHLLEATYSGDSNFNASTSGTLNVNTGMFGGTLQISPSANPTNYGSPVTLTATLNPYAVSDVTTDGDKVYFQNGGTVLGAGTLSSGVATLTTTALPAGIDPVKATFPGDRAFMGSASSAFSLTVRPATPKVNVTPSSTIIAQAEALALTIAVSEPSGVPAPTGTVKVTSGSYASAPKTLKSGSATIDIPAGSLPLGTDTLEVSYSGDANDSPSTSSVAVTVNNSIFKISGTAVSLSAGATTGNTSTITVTPSGGFIGSVTLTAKLTTSPTGAVHPPTLSFGTTSPVSITGTTAGKATLTIDTTASSTKSCTSANRMPRGIPWYAGGGAVLAGVFLFGIRARRRHWRSMLGMALLLAAFAGGALACGVGGGGSSCTDTVIPGTTAGKYTVTVTASGGAIAEDGTVTLTVK